MSTSGFFGTSVGRKIFMALTGFFLIVFLLVHLGVNALTLLNDPEWFNLASHFMATNILLNIMEYVLALGFLAHIIAGIVLTVKNKSARPVNYRSNNPGTGSTFTSRSMAVTGLLVLLFIALHLKDYFYVMRFGEMKDLDNYGLVVSLFSAWYYTLLYVIAFVLLGAHLHHGFQSAFQSMGWNHRKYTPWIKRSGIAYCLLIGAGFSAIAIFHFVASLN